MRDITECCLRRDGKMSLCSLIISPMSDMCSKYRIGPKTDPRGTP